MEEGNEQYYDEVTVTDVSICQRGAVKITIGYRDLLMGPCLMVVNG